MAGTTVLPQAASKKPRQQSDGGDGDGDDVGPSLVLNEDTVPTELKVATTKRRQCTDDSDDEYDDGGRPRSPTVLWTVVELFRRAEEEHRRRPLVLVLDLDHTLLHTVGADCLSPNELYLLAPEEEPPAAGGQRPLLFNMADTLGYITKLRPFVDTFLFAASTMFRLCVCTMGVRSYANQMVRLLDPEGRFFAPGDVISREDYRKTGIKDLDRVRWGDEQTTLILDDTADVWAMRHQHNLIKMPAYNYFAHGGSGSGSWSLAEKGMDEEEGSHALSGAMALLWEIHRAFYFDPDAVKDVRVLLRGRQLPLV